PGAGTVAGVTRHKGRNRGTGPWTHGRLSQGDSPRSFAGSLLRPGFRPRSFAPLHNFTVLHDESHVNKNT
ncbi:MAG: hypothetical protein SCM88_06875, partial [Bacillota bacterium]|nr:hypothetical protein [Bacillota bacterium]